MSHTISDLFNSHPLLPSRVTSGWPPAARERHRSLLQLVECDEAITFLNGQADAIAAKVRDLSDTDPHCGKLALLLGVTIHALEDHRRLAEEVRAMLPEKEAGPVIREEARRAW